MSIKNMVTPNHIHRGFGSEADSKDQDIHQSQGNGNARRDNQPIEIPNFEF
jgi:hypothetical protein